jgi:hypothetical protein
MTHPTTADCSGVQPVTARQHRRLERQHPQGTEVPLSVWLTEPLTGCCPTCADPTGTACARRIPLALARQITAAYSQPGDLVYVPDAGNANLLIAPAAAGRRVLGYAHTPDHARTTQNLLAEQGTEIASLTVLRHAPLSTLPGKSERTARRARLALLAPHHPHAAPAMAALLDATVRTLQPGGVAVIATRQTPGTDRPGQLTAYARAAGLVYLQHIAAVEATAADGRLQPAAPPAGHGPDCTCPSAGALGAGPHRITHLDLLVLTKP